jgi:ubiquinone/menaquinone biosynthesis C-methylase UbiE/DNA-binding transcriptional ArsR family regulator
MVKMEELFKACADRTRLKILFLLALAELSVADLVAVLQTGQSRISHHLKILLDAGLVRLRKEGLWSYYSLRKEEKSGLTGFVLPRLQNAAYTEELKDALEDHLRSKKESTRAFFDTVAGEWNTLREELVPDATLVAIITALKNHGVIMDIGCGTGSLLQALSESGRELIGVDQSARMLQQAAEQTAPSRGRVQFRFGDAEHLPAKEAEIGIAVLNMVLHHLPIPARGLKEAARVLTQGGSLVITELLPHNDEEFAQKFGDMWRGISEAQLTSWLEEAGLTIVSKETVPSGTQKQAVIIVSVKNKGDQNET